MSLRGVYLLCAILVAIALGLFTYKVGVLQFPMTPNKDAQSWVIAAKLRFYADGNAPVQARFFTPLGNNGLARVTESFIASDYGLTKKLGKQTGNRRATWTKRDVTGRQTLFYQAIYYELKSPENTAPLANAPNVIAGYTPIAAPVNGRDVTPLDQAMLSIIADARGRSADNVGFVIELVKLLKLDNDDRINIIKQAKPDGASSLVALVAQIANAANVPTRVVNGIALKQHLRRANIIQWLDVYIDNRWQSIDADSDKPEISDLRLPWWYGTDKLVALDGGHDTSVEISVRYNHEDAVTLARWKSQSAAPWLERVSLFDLPLDTQIMFGILLMIPVGALVIVALRQLIGVPTFGTFMPVLIALSFRETGLWWGMALFGVIVAVGLVLRAYFDRLRLLVVPRLASILTVVILLMAILTLITYKLGINAGLSITLFPMIILTMMIERIALMSEELGAAEARRTLYGSIFAAIVAYVAMNSGLVGHLVFVFPELLLIVLACTILLGRYNGYKFSEYRRFKKLAKAIEEGAQ